MRGDKIKSMKKKTGKITPNGVVLKAHENATVVFLTECGYDIELIPRSNVEGVHTPDIKMDGLKWEMKSPKGKGKWLLKNTVQRASHQSENIIIDLHRIKIHQVKCLQELEKQFKFSKRVKRMLIVTKSRKLLAFNK